VKAEENPRAARNRYAEGDGETGRTEPVIRTAAKREKIPAARLWALGGLGGLFIAAFVLSLQWKASGKITTVSAGGAVHFSEKEILARARVPMGALLDTLSLGAVRERLLTHPYVRDARVTRMYPDAVAISISERIPVASFMTNGLIRYLDADGVVLPFMPSEVPYDLPVISGIPELQRTRVGEVVGNEDFFEAVSILDAALESDTSVYRLISEVDMKNGGDVLLFSSEVAVPIIFGRGEAERKFTILHTFWEKFVREEGPENLKYIDLRYSDQVVAKWNNKPRKSFNASSM
jgi:cell division septal protein FtsQ